MMRAKKLAEACCGTWNYRVSGVEDIAKVITDLCVALLDVRLSYRGAECWCEESWNTDGGRHSYACQKARAALAEVRGEAPNRNAGNAGR